MILVILPESAAGLYSGVKRWGDITRGVITQCVVSLVSSEASSRA